MYSHNKSSKSKTIKRKVQRDFQDILLEEKIKRIVERPATCTASQLPNPVVNVVEHSHTSTHSPAKSPELDDSVKSCNSVIDHELYNSDHISAANDDSTDYVFSSDAITEYLFSSENDN